MRRAQPAAFFVFFHFFLLKKLRNFANKILHIYAENNVIQYIVN